MKTRYDSPPFCCTSSVQAYTTFAVDAYWKYLVLVAALLVTNQITDKLDQPIIVISIGIKAHREHNRDPINT